MRFYQTVFILYLLCFGNVFAQTISGKVSDQKGKPMEFATITLKKFADSSFVTGTITDENGRFELAKLKNGNYLLFVNAIGYKPYVSQKLIIPTDNGSLEITIEEDTRVLGEVQVRAQKPVIEQEAGKTTVNVENSIVSQGLMAIELLKRTPGVSVDNDGNITLKGKENVLLMIDGKPTYLSAKQAASILKSLPSNQISNIEVMTTPPAKYDAQGNAGVININLKKGGLSGQNGSVHGSLGHGFMPKSNIGVALTWGLKKWTLNSAYDFTANEDFNVYTQSRTYGNPALGQKYSLYQRYNVASYSNSYRVGADFRPTEKLSFSAVHRGIVSSDVYYSDGLKGRVLDANGNLKQELTTKDHNPDRFYNFAGGLNSKYKFDTSGHELSADVDASLFQQRSTQTTSTTLFENGVLTNAANWDGRLPTDVYNFNFKIDYARKLMKNMKLEVGIKRIDMNINSETNYSTSQAGTRILGLPTGNSIVFYESISAAYASVDYKKDKFTAVVGVRTEWWKTEGKQLNTGQRFFRDSIVPFPNIMIKYKIFEKHELSINYNKRIDRPEYNFLNPIAYYTDPYTVFQGNPRLRPQLANNFELAHSFLDGTLITTLSFSEITNYIRNYVLIPNADSTKPQAMTSVNIPLFRNMGISMSLNLPITKYWTSQFFVNGFQNQYFGNLFGSDLNLKKWAYTANTSQTFTLPKDWAIEVSGTYFSPTLEGYTLVRQMGMVSLGVQKNLFDSRATVKLAAQDVFYTFIYNTETNYAGLSATNRYRWDNRLVTLSFVYKFGRNRFNSNEKEDEKLKTGGRL